MLFRRLFMLAALPAAVAVSNAAAQSPEEPTLAAIAARHKLTLEQAKRLDGYRGLSRRMLHDLPTGRIRRLVWRQEEPRPTDAKGGLAHIVMINTGGVAEVPDSLEKAVAQTQALAANAAAAATRPGGAMLAQSTVAGVSVDVISVAGLPVHTSGGVGAQSVDPARRGLGVLDYAPLLPSATFVPRAAGDLSPRNWKWLGPTDTGGRTRAIVVHPRQPSTMWAAAATGGVWKSVDAGESWAPLADFLPSLNVATLVHVDGPGEGALFAGTGEAVSSSADRGRGIFRSLDGGVTWVQLPGSVSSEFQIVSRLAFAKAPSGNGETMLVAARSGLYVASNALQPDPSQVKLRRVAELSGTGFVSVACSPKTPNVCLAGGYNARVLRSEDGGATWAPVAGLPAPAGKSHDGRVELAWTRAGDGSVVYAGIDIDEGEIWCSTDNGRTFERRNTGARYMSQGYYHNTIWAGHPTDADLVVVGGLDLHRSTDGGRTLTRISDWRLSPRSAHADQLFIVAHPAFDGTTNRTLYFGNDGGVYRHENILEASVEVGWTALNKNYGVTQFYSAAGSARSGRVIGGTQDNGTLTYVPPPGDTHTPQSFLDTAGGDGGYSAADPEDESILYGSYVHLKIHRSLDGGETARYIFKGIADVSANDSSLFIAPFVLDPANRNVMLAGGASLWRSRDVTAPEPQWQAIRQPLSPAAAGARTPLISAVEARPVGGGTSGSNHVWVGYTNGEIHMSDNATADQPTWVSLTPSGSVLPHRIVTRLRFVRDLRSPDQAGALYAAFGGYFKDNLWRSADGGRTWASVHGNLPEMAVRDITIHPANPDWLYVATQLGVFASADAGRTWAPTNSGPANVSTTELFWLGERLVGATFGRGIFWIDLSGASAVAGVPTVAPREPAATGLPKGAAQPDQGERATDWLRK